MKTLNFFTTCTVPIEVFDKNNKNIGNATGFFYLNKKNELLLITNWHVVTGRNHFKKSLSNGATPTMIRFKMHLKLHDEKLNKPCVSHKYMTKLELNLNSEDGNKPNWLEHPVNKGNIDVVAIRIEIKQLAEKYHYFTINQFQGFEPCYKGEPMDDIFVIVYPWGIKYFGTFPLYKKGSIASEPLINFTELPTFLIDCRTSPSMSGSPVIGSKSGLWHQYGVYEENGVVRGDTLINGVQNFLGVYSGRLKSNDYIDEIPEIGLVWKASLIEDIVNNGVTGTTLNSILDNI